MKPKELIIEVPEKEDIEIENDGIEVELQNHTVSQKMIPGPKGEDGLTPTEEQLLDIIIPLIPAPIAGKNGKNGETPTKKVLQEIIKPLIPKPIKGEDGKDGKDLKFTDLTPYQIQLLTGAPGNPGEGVPRGGTTGQKLIKASARNFHTEWADDSAGGAVDSVNGATGVVVLDQDDIGDGTTYKQYSQTEKTKLAGIETGADVTDTANVTSAGALMDSELADLTAIKTLQAPDNTTISTFGASLVDDANASTARTTLGVSIGTDVQAYSSVLANTTASFTTADETKLDNITVTQAVNLDTMESDIAALANGMVYKGNWDASAGTFPGAGVAQAGWFYTVSVGGTVDSVVFNVGDRLIATTDNASSTTYASNWTQLDATDAVTSVFGRTGNVVATSGDYSASQVTNAFDKSTDDTDDITVGTTNKFATAAEKTKLGFISVTQAVDLDTIESDTTTNNAKVTNATHSGDMVGATSLTAQPALITGKSSATVASGDLVLIADINDSNNLKQVTAQSIADLGGAGSGATTALDNLAGVAINTSLISDTNETDDLGSATIKWLNIFVRNIGATATRITKGWFTDLEVTNLPTVNGGTLASALNLSGTNTGDQTSVSGNAGTATALATPRTIGTATGDVTSAGSSFDGTANNTNALTIANSAVTLAKMANLAQDQFIGRTTASTGVPETATITAAARTVLDDTTVGAMVDTLGGATSTGTGGLVRATSPVLVTPALGTPASGNLSNCTGIPAPSGGTWAELASVTLSGTAVSVDSGTITAKKELMVYFFATGKSATSPVGVQFNADTGTNYSWQLLRNATSGTAQSATSVGIQNNNNTTDVFGVLHIHNATTAGVKMGTVDATEWTGTAAAAMLGLTGKFGWADTTNQITSIQVVPTLGGGITFNTGSYIKVYGRD